MTATLTVATVGPAFATDGYFAHGFGARHKALGGAGVADGRDSTSAALNPAGLVHLERTEFTAAASFFSPHRTYDISGPTAVAPFAGPASVESDKNLFVIPNMAYALRTPGNPYFDVFALTVYGNGGMNTSWPATAFGSTYGLPSGRTGVNLEQAFISAAFAKQFGDVSIGIAPIVARQQFRAVGLDGFGVPDADDDVSWGVGVRGGLEWSVMPGVRLGVAGNSRVYMERFKGYARLFAERGDFDIPASVQAGIAVDLTPSLTVMADYKHIWYSSIKAINNPSANFFTAPLGSTNGAGFGWEDIDIIKIGVEWDASDALTLRAGYSYNTQPIQSQDVTINVLAPGVVQHHITAGAELDLDDNWSLELAGMYAPEKSVSGPDLFTGAFGGRETISMYQYEVTAGIKYKWGQ